MPQLLLNTLALRRTKDLQVSPAAPRCAVLCSAALHCTVPCCDALRCDARSRTASVCHPRRWTELALVKSMLHLLPGCYASFPQVNGRRLVALPAKTVHLVQVQLSREERLKYERWEEAGEVQMG